MSTRVPVQVDADQFDRLARPTQILAAVAELVWNALDAEADVVTVTIGRTEMDAVDHVVVTDDGHGMTHDGAIQDFEKLGGSWKKQGTGGRRLSMNGKRSLHGSAGEGRFRAFALGKHAVWTTISATESGLQRTVISGTVGNSEFDVTDAEALATGSSGTDVRVTDPRERVNRLLGDDAVQQLIPRFAAYMIKYPSVEIIYDGTRLDAESILERQAEIALDESLGGEHGAPSMRVLEWKSAASAIKSSLVLCDENGVALHELEDVPSYGASAIRYTAYVTWAGFATHKNELLLAEVHPDISPVIDAAKSALREYLDGRAAEQRQSILEKWKAQNVYPYDDEPQTPIEEHERRVFDVVAVTAAPAVAQEPKAARLSLQLIKSALERSPEALHRVLQEVLDLTPEQLADFDQLLARTTLASLIHTNKLVTDRLDFLVDLENMLFDTESKRRLLERRELHRILANGHTWVFGEQYTLAVDDKGLRKVLEAHLKLFGEDPPVLAPVTDAEGKTRIVDLMLSKASQRPTGRHHLVVELKRPNVVLTQKELAQITDYAIAVATDERFKTPDVTWEFWLVGDDMDDAVEALVNQKDQPPGLYMERGNYRIWVRRWAELLEENRQRLHFYREHLDFEPGDDLDYEGTLAKYLPSKENVAAS